MQQKLKKIFFALPALKIHLHMKTPTRLRVKSLPQEHTLIDFIFVIAIIHPRTNLLTLSNELWDGRPAFYPSFGYDLDAEHNEAYVNYCMQNEMGHLFSESSQDSEGSDEQVDFEKVSMGFPERSCTTHHCTIEKTITMT